MWEGEFLYPQVSAEGCTLAPLPHYSTSREPSLAHGVPYTKSFLAATPSRSLLLSSQMRFLLTMEVISDNAEVGQLVPLTCEFIVDFR
jgi:hypothetical protein